MNWSQLFISPLLRILFLFYCFCWNQFLITNLLDDCSNDYLFDDPRTVYSPSLNKVGMYASIVMHLAIIYSCTGKFEQKRKQSLAQMSSNLAVSVTVCEKLFVPQNVIFSLYTNSLSATSRCGWIFSKGLFRFYAGHKFILTKQWQKREQIKPKNVENQTQC